MVLNRARAANSVLWSALENGGLAIISLSSLIIYSKLLTPSEFGLYSITLSVVELLGVVVGMLFHDALVQRQDINDWHYDTAFTATITISLLLVLGCWALSPQFATVVGEPQASAILRVMCLVLPCSGLGAVAAAQQRREFRFRSLALRSLIGRVVGGVVGIIAAFAGAGLWSLVLQQILMALLGSVVLMLASKRFPRPRFRMLEYRELIIFSLYSVSGIFIQFSARRLFTILTGIALGVVQAGYLNIAFRIIDVLWSISSTAVSQVALPVLASLQKDQGKLKRAHRASVEFSCLILYPVFVGLGVIAPEVVQLLFGSQWLPSAPSATILSFLVIAQAPRLFTNPLLSAIGRPQDALVGFTIELIFTVVIVEISHVSTPLWASGIWAARELVLFPVFGFLLHRATGYFLMEQIAGAVVPLIAVVTMAASVVMTRLVLSPFLTPTGRIAILVPIGAIVYVTTIILEDRRILRNLFEFIMMAFPKNSSNNGVNVAIDI